MKDIRVQQKRNRPYRSASNKFKVVKTPGGKLVAQYLTKHAEVPHCGDCGTDLHGLKAYRPYVRHSLSKRHKTVSRAYGGSRCARCVRNRIVRAFLKEEKKKVKAVLAAAKAPKKVAKKATKAGKGKTKK